MSSSNQRFVQSPGPRQVVAVPRGKAPVKALGSFVPQLTRKAFEKFGFSTATLIMDWPAIIGVEVAGWTQPERLKWPRQAGEGGADGVRETQGRAGATLVLRVDDARALDVQYKSKQLIERINSYFGYAAIADLRIVQGPIERGPPMPGRRRKPAPIVRSEPPATSREVSGIAYEPLREALAKLGAAVRGS